MFDANVDRFQARRYVEEWVVIVVKGFVIFYIYRILCKTMYRDERQRDAERMWTRYN